MVDMMSLPASTVVSSAGVLVLPQAARLRAMARDKVKARNFFIQTDLLYFGAPASQGDTLSINHYSMHSQ